MNSRAGLVVCFFLAAACAAPTPPPPPASPPPRPTLQPVPIATPEEVSIQGRSTPIGGGRQKFTITINGDTVIEDTLSDKNRSGRFRGTWKGHDVLAECALNAKVECAVSLDAAPDRPGSMPPPAPEAPKPVTPKRSR